MAMSSTERTALLGIIRRTTNTAKAEVDSLAAERLVAFERQSAEQYSAQKIGVGELIDEANAEIAPYIESIRRRVNDYCDDNGIPHELRPVVAGGGVMVTSRAMAYYGDGRLAELRRVAKAEIEAGKKRAKAEIDRHRTELELQVLSDAIESAAATKLLAIMPTAEALLPRLDVLEIESRRAGGR